MIAENEDTLQEEGEAGPESPEGETAARRLGRDSGQIRLEGIADNRTVALSMLRQARRDIRWLSRQLDPQAFNNEEIAMALRETIRDNSRCEIRILLFHPEVVVQEGHHVLEAAMRFSSSIRLRRPSSDYDHYIESFLLVDDTGFLHRPIADRWEGAADFNDPTRVRLLAKTFDTIWESATPDPNLRRLMG